MEGGSLLINMLGLGGGYSQNIQGMTGTPMVAASPERHDGGLQANPVEVQSYQPPWKVLSDFALQSDIDQPAFQQLVSVSSQSGEAESPKKGDSDQTVTQLKILGVGRGPLWPSTGESQGRPCGRKECKDNRPLVSLSLRLRNLTIYVEFSINQACS